jgi:leucyl aminopeptidase
MPTVKFTISSNPYKARKGDLICLPFLDGRTPAFPQSHVPRKLASVRAPSKAGGGRTVFVGELGGNHAAARTKRLDAEHSSPRREARMMVASALAQATKLACRRVVVILDGVHEDLCEAVQEGALLGGYGFDKYLSDKPAALSVLLTVKTPNLTTMRRGLAGGARVAECVNFARDLLNEPPNVIFPESLAAELQRFGADAGLEVEVWDEARLAAERCEGILAVGKGSSRRPRMVVGRYAPEGARLHLALVGKGVTFDTGGYCLKPPASQKGMKLDMGGAAMMFAGACAIARLGLPIKVTVWAPLAHNDISSTAYHTTDILRLRGGKSVQIDNTDAEGRLLLADALDLACEAAPDYLVDAATLTGACVVALGEDIAGVYGTDRELVRAVLDAGERAGENLWEMPLHMPYMSQLKTPIADCSNVGGRWGGSITAALFLRQFVKDDVKWVHVDVAGPAGKEDPLDHLGKGAKGYGVKTIAALAAALSS